MIFLQSREPFGFIGWERGFHLSMAFNAEQTATGAVRAKTASPIRDHGLAGRDEP
jgi:hypothetical protein